MPLKDGEDGELADGHQGLASEEDPGEGVFLGGNAVPAEDVVLELERDGLGQGRAGDGDLALEGGDDAGLGRLGQGQGGGEEQEDEDRGAERARPCGHARSAMRPPYSPNAAGLVNGSPGRLS